MVLHLFFSFLSGVEVVMEYNFKYCRGLRLLYYGWSILTAVASPLLVGSKKKIKTIEPMGCILRSVFFCMPLGSCCGNISVCTVNFYNSLEWEILPLCLKCFGDGRTSHAKLKPEVILPCLLLQPQLCTGITSATCNLISRVMWNLLFQWHDLCSLINII